MFVSSIVLQLQDAAGEPLDVTAVTLSDISSAYGLVELADGDVVVPAGIELERLDTGRYEYHILLALGKIYRYAVKIQQGDRAFYLRGYLCPEAQSAELSFSLSESDSESTEPPVDGRSVRLRREDSRRVFIFGQANSHRMRVSVVDAAGISRHLLGHLKRSIDQEGGEIEQFAMIASPRDIAVYPTLTPSDDQAPAYYLKDTIDIILPHADAADAVWERIKQEVDNLIATYNRSDALGL